MTDWVIRLIDWGGYAGVFLLMLLETMFPPIPSEVILPIAGMRAAQRRRSTLPGVIVASGTAGAMAGNLIWYLVARSIGLDRFRRFIDRYGRWLTLDWYDVEKVQRLFGRFGAGIVFVGRMLPTVRTFISVPGRASLGCGSSRFLIWSTIGTAGLERRARRRRLCARRALRRRSTRSPGRSPRRSSPRSSSGTSGASSPGSRQACC